MGKTTVQQCNVRSLMFLLAVFVSAAAALDKFHQGQGESSQEEEQHRRHVQQEVGGPGLSIPLIFA